MLKRIKRKVQYSCFRQRWNIGVARCPVAELAGLEGQRLQDAALEQVAWMDEERNGFAADPFVIESEIDADAYDIFYEYLPWHADRGRVDSVVFQASAFLPERRTVLSLPHHLSYPFVIWHNNAHFCIPEQAEGGALMKYQISHYRDFINPEMVEVPEKLVDTTVFYDNGRFWLFATVHGERVNSDLYIFFADSLSGSWTAHPQNPVKRDSGSARPAGQIIAHKGRHFRPAQDCRTHYGAGIVFQEIDTLTTERFEEKEVSELRPDKSSLYNYGLHTISSAGSVTVIDGARMESIFHPALDRLGALFIR